MRIPAWFSNAYAPAEVPSLARLATCHEALQRMKLISARQARPVPLATLHGLHDARYIQDFLEGKEPSASRHGLPWSPRLRDATLAMLGGQLQAAEHSLQHRTISMNLARGFHHAFPAGGSGFCPINGLALVAHAWPSVRIVVLDCDEHGGNGTEEFAAVMPNLYAISIFGTRFGCRGGTRSWAFKILPDDGFNAYQEALASAWEIIDHIRPDLVLYQAGVDCHLNDPKSLLRMSTLELFRRDRQVFDAAVQRRLPLAFVVAGGYQQAERVARLNVNTVRAARMALHARA